MAGSVMAAPPWFGFSAFRARIATRAARWQRAARTTPYFLHVAPASVVPRVRIVMAGFRASREESASAFSPPMVFLPSRAVGSETGLPAARAGWSEEMGRTGTKRPAGTWRIRANARPVRKTAFSNRAASFRLWPMDVAVERDRVGLSGFGQVAAGLPRRNADSDGAELKRRSPHGGASVQRRPALHGKPVMLAATKPSRQISSHAQVLRTVTRNQPQLDSPRGLYSRVSQDIVEIRGVGRAPLAPMHGGTMGARQNFRAADSGVDAAPPGAPPAGADGQPPLRPVPRPAGVLDAGDEYHGQAEFRDFIGRILERGAGRPAIGRSGFDARRSPLPLGRMIGG